MDNNYKQVRVIFILRVTSKKYSVKYLSSLFLSQPKESIEIGMKKRYGSGLYEENGVEFMGESFDYINIEESLEELLNTINLKELHKFTDTEISVGLYIPIYSKYANPGIWINAEHTKMLAAINAEIHFDVFQLGED